MTLARRTMCALVFGATLGLATAAAAKVPQKVLKFGVAAEPYPPFTTQQASGKWVGFEIDLMHAVCAAQHLQCEVYATAYDGIFAALNARKLDVIWTSVGITDERKKIVDFTSKYYDTPAAIIGPKSSTMKLSTGNFSALKGKIVGVQTSTIYGAFFRKYLPGQVTLKEYDTQDDADSDLAAGRLDAVMANSVALSEFLKSDQGRDMRVLLTIPSSYDRSVFGYGVAGAVRKSDSTLRETLNAGIAAIRQDGTYQRIARKYFDFDVYGG